MDIRVRTEATKIHIDKNETGVWTVLGYFDTKKGEGWYLRARDFFDREPVNSLAALEGYIFTKYGIRYDLAREIKKAREIESNKNAENEYRRMCLATAKEFGKRFDPKTVHWVIVQEGVGAICEVENFFLFLNIPYNKVYAFNKEQKSMLWAYSEKLSEAKDFIWCHCGYKGKSVEYVTNYRGQTHGHICPKCKRYKQIG